MMKVTLWLSVYRNDQVWAADTIWYKEIETGCVPIPGADMTILWAYEEDPGDGPQWGIRERRLHADGEWHVQLYDMVVNASSVVLSTQQVWHSDDDTRPEALLEAGGWQKYV